MEFDDEPEGSVADIAAAIGEPARARILFCLLDGRARTSTELSVVADVSTSTASAHLNRLLAVNLVKVTVQGRHRYYGLAGERAAQALESLSVLATDGMKTLPRPRVPLRLRDARTCYDHLAGSTGVALHDRLLETGWLIGSGAYEVTELGKAGFASIGIDVDAVRLRKRRFACACLDWSERRTHLAGALGAAVLRTALDRKWLVRDLDGRALSVTSLGGRELVSRFGMHSQAAAD